MYQFIKITALHFILLLSFSDSFSSENRLQSLPDSLLIRIGITTLDSNAVRFLSQKCWENRNADVDLATVYGKAAIELARNLKFNEGLAQALNLTGVVYRNKENFVKALELCLEAKSIAEQDSNLTELGYAYNNIGEIYRYERNYTLSIENIKKSRDIFKRLGNLTGLGYANIRLGEVSVDAGYYPDALDYFTQSADIRKRMGDDRNLSVVYNRMGELFILTGKYDEALSRLEEALKIRNRLNDERGKSETYTLLGRVYFSTKNYSQAITYAEKGLQIAREVNSPQRIFTASEVLFQSLAKTGNFKRAFDIQTVYSQYKDSVFSIEKSRQVQSIQENFNDREQRQRILDLERERSLREDDAQRKNLVIILAIGGLLASSILLGFLFKAYSEKRLSNIQLEEKNDEIRLKSEEVTRQAQSLVQANRKIQESNQQLSQINQALLTEINERKQMELALIEAKQQAEAATRAKSRFISIMSHEIRTPLNAVIGITDWLLEDSPKQEQLEHLNSLKFAAGNLLAILTDILDFSKIEAGKMDIESIQFSLKSLVENVVRTFRKEAEKKGLSFRIEVEGNWPEHVMGDPVRLGQVLTNLISNAIKFTREGAVALRLRILPETDNRKVPVTFEVSDTGIGIALDQQHRIFESFTQASSSTTREYGGTGLGLSIVHRLVKLMGGQIVVRSKPGEGSTFSFSLEFYQEKLEQPEIIETASTDANLLAGKHVLLVDDNYLNVKMASRFLSKWGMVVETAENGQIAVDKALENHFDVILMDLQMPVMDGISATRRIRLNTPNVPIYALTADAMEESKETVLNEGMQGLIVKPFKSEELKRKLERLFIR